MKQTQHSQHKASKPTMDLAGRVQQVIDQPSATALESLRVWVNSNIFSSLANLTSAVPAFKEELWEMFEKGLSTVVHEQKSVEEVLPGFWKKWHLSKKFVERHVEVAKDWTERVGELTELCNVVLPAEELRDYTQLLLFLSISDNLIAQWKRTSNMIFLDYFSSLRTCGTNDPNPLKGDIGRGILPPSFRRWIGKCMSERRKRDPDRKILINTIFQGFKRGLLPVSVETIGKNLNGHWKNLTFDDEQAALDFEGLGREVLPGDKASYVDELRGETYEEAFHRVIPQIIGNLKINSGCREGSITRTATVESTFANFGELGYALSLYSKNITKWLGKEDLPLMSHSEFLGFSHRGLEVRPVYACDVPRDEELLHLVQGDLMGHFEPVVEGNTSVAPTELAKLAYAAAEAAIGESSPIQEFFEIHLDPVPELLLEMSEFLAIHKLRREFVMRDSRARPAMILEPLKVRIITKPGIFDYTRLRSVQKGLWKKLKDLKPFHLIAGHDPDLVVTRFVGESEWTAGEFWNSGDYSAATDKLRGYVSETVLDCVASAIEDPIAVLEAYRTMTGCTIEWDKVPLPSDNSVFEAYRSKLGVNFSRFKKAYTREWRERWNLVEGKQTNGQLMGNVLSFPILCLANYMTFHLSVEKYHGRHFTFRELESEVLINGDDILFKTDRRLFQIWREISADFGFEMSAGKNLVSDDLIQINSQLWQTRTSARGDLAKGFQGYRLDRLEKIGYVNFGLITNRRKNDCTKDFVNKPVLLQKMEGKAAYDEQMGRLTSLGAIAETIYETLGEPHSSELHNRVERLVKKHRDSFLSAMGLSKLAKCFNYNVDTQLWDKYLRSLVPPPGQGRRDALDSIKDLRQVDLSRSSYRRFESTLTIDEFREFWRNRPRQPHDCLYVHFCQSSQGVDEPLQEWSVVVHPRTLPVVL